VTAQADVDAIKQVFWNLCDNALKAMAEGGTLSVEAFESGQRAVILFQDTGCGIHPRQADKVFEPFQSDFRAGAGLGLAIVYEIVTAHQGTVSAEPRPGGGTTFRLTLPLDRREAAARQPEARSVVN
jgi:signal transduction histidine kinase